jgi:hypothetical protein
MIWYEVVLSLEPSLAPRIEDYMRQSHIPAIYATGCFRHIRFFRSSAGQFRTSYEAESQAELDRYLEEHAPRLRAEFQQEVPSGVSIARTIWFEQEVWG